MGECVMVRVWWQGEGVGDGVGYRSITGVGVWQLRGVEVMGGETLIKAVPVIYCMCEVSPRYRISAIKRRGYYLFHHAIYNVLRLLFEGSH